MAERKYNSVIEKKFLFLTLILQKAVGKGLVVCMNELQMMVSSRLRKDGKQIVRVSFFRGKDYADGILPDIKIEKSEGFSADEIRQLERYMREHQEEIFAKAKTIDPMKNWLGLK